MLEKKICPGCGRRCDLSEPHCSRGEEYLRTEKISGSAQGGEYSEPCRNNDCGLDLNDRLVHDLLDLGHVLRSQYEGRASQKRILIILNETGSITQKDLTERLGIQPGSASEILAKLENAGLIIRTQNENDRRTTDVCLTDTGRGLAGNALTQRQKRHAEMFSCLSEEEKGTLLSLMEKVCADWRVRYRESGKPHGHGGHHGGDHAGHEDHGGHHGGDHAGQRRNGGN